MEKKGLNYIILLILLCVTAAFVFDILKFKKLPTESSKILEFPITLGPYEGKDLALEERVYDILNTDTILLREYSKGDGIPVWFLIVYGEQDRQSFHPPEYCYMGGSDVQLLDKTVKTVSLDKDKLEVNRLFFEMPAYRQLVYYWYTAGNKMTASYYKQQIFFMMEQMKRKKVGGTLIRVSTIMPAGETEEGAHKRISEFLNLALPKIKEIL